MNFKHRILLAAPVGTWSLLPYRIGTHDYLTFDIWDAHLPLCWHHAILVTASVYRGIAVFYFYAFASLPVGSASTSPKNSFFTFSSHLLFPTTRYFFDRPAVLSPSLPAFCARVLEQPVLRPTRRPVSLPPVAVKIVEPDSGIDNCNNDEDISGINPEASWTQEIGQALLWKQY